MSEEPAVYHVVGIDAPDPGKPGPAALAVEVPPKLARLSQEASEAWSVVERLGGGSVRGGLPLDWPNGSRQSQIAAFDVPRLRDDDPRDPAAIQLANAQFAVACVSFVRGLLARSPGE